MSRAPGKRVVLVGAGGNIGSHAVGHLARTPEVGEVVLVDGGDYDESNLRTQDIRRCDVGRSKVSVQAKRLRAIDPTLPVEAIAAFVEDVPLGRLRGDVMLAAVDSKAARRNINDIAWRLGMPWIDSGVNGEELLARVNAYRPDDGQPCLECAWDQSIYDALEHTHTCTGRGNVAATNAPSSLGALAASLLTLECGKLLTGRWEEVAVARQVTVSARSHRTLVTTLTRNPRCRFAHRIWRIEAMAPDAHQCSLEQILDLGRHALATTDAVGLTVAGQLFAKRLTCLRCGAARGLAPYLFGRLGADAGACSGCGNPMQVAGFDAIDWLHPSDLPPEVRDAPLSSLGLRRGDVVSLSNHQGITHFELGGLQ